MNNDFLSALNDSQRAAVEYCDGPQLVVAGAGSGKTRVLTYKIAYLLDHYGMKPWNILALTFTNKAAREMKERIAALVGGEAAQYLQMGTFHSIFARLLRYEAAAIGYTPDYTIYDESDSRTLIKNIVKEKELDEKAYKPASVHAVISNAKNSMRSAADYAADGDRLRIDREHNMPELYRVFETYEQRLRQANAMDFDDLLVNTFRLLFDNEEIRRKYADRFKYVLVDEYQDTNHVQQQIVTLLTRDHQRITVVGDDYQSIYAFRGARISNILEFQQIYPGARLFKLEQNYRSTQNIVSAANSLMKHNRHQIPKDVYSRNEEGDKVTVIETYNDKREAAVVCREIKRLRQQEGLSWNDFAILYRTNAQSRTFEDEMRKPEVGMGGNYRIYGGLSFYQRKEIKDVIAYMRLVVNPHDEEALRRIINYPARGIGNTTVQRLAEAAEVHGVSMWEVISHPAEHGLNANKGTLKKLTDFRTMIETFSQQAQQTDAMEMLNEIMTQAGIKADLNADMSVEGETRRENVDQLAGGVASFLDVQREEGRGEETRLSDYLATVSLLTDADNDNGQEEKVTMMTIHSAKGLEYPVVFIVGLEQDILPSAMSRAETNGLEEERRLLYVAITRAEKHCYLSWTHNRWMYGKSQDCFESPFLAEIDSKYTRQLVDSDGGGSYGFGGYGSRGNTYGSGRRKPWEDDVPSFRSSRYQNSRPVGDRFMADPQPKITSPRQPERPVNPFSPAFEQQLRQRGLRRVSEVTRPSATSAAASTTSGRPAATPVSSASDTTPSGGLQPGTIVEHARFGRGTVRAVEGQGDQAKAIVDFERTGQKQLLLKFARLTIVG